MIPEIWATILVKFHLDAWDSKFANNSLSQFKISPFVFFERLRMFNLFKEFKFSSKLSFSPFWFLFDFLFDNVEVVEFFFLLSHLLTFSLYFWILFLLSLLVYKPILASSRWFCEKDPIDNGFFLLCSQENWDPFIVFLIFWFLFS